MVRAMLYSAFVKLVILVGRQPRNSASALLDELMGAIFCDYVIERRKSASRRPRTQLGFGVESQEALLGGRRV